MFSDLSNCIAWTLMTVLVWTAQPAVGQAKATTNLELKLRNYGWEPPVRHQVDRPSIMVDHEGRVLVSFTVREHKGLVTRTQPSLSLRIVRFQGNSVPDLSLSLPTNAGGITAIYLSEDDRIIARADDSLQLLERAGRDSQESVWKTLAQCAQQCHIEQSFSRRTLFLYTEDADSASAVIRLSQQPALQRCGKTPRLEYKFQDYPESITDEFAYSLGGEKTYRWPLCDYEHRVELPLKRARWTALDDRFLVKAAYDFRKNEGSLVVVSPDAQVKFRRDLLKHESVDTLLVPIRSSEQGERIAVDMLTIRGANRTLDLSGHVTARRIAVYDIEAGREVASVPVNPKHRYHYEFDLSPNGKRLAILEDDTVKLVDLEPAHSGDEATAPGDTYAVDLKNGNLQSSGSGHQAEAVTKPANGLPISSLPTNSLRRVAH